MEQGDQKEYRYLELARKWEQQIQNEVLKWGDKLPSVRAVSRAEGVSMGTVLQAFLELEKKGMIRSRPQSGYYVCYQNNKLPALPRKSQPVLSRTSEEPDAIIQKVYRDIDTTQALMLSLGVPAESLLPVAKLNKGLVAAMRGLRGSGTEYDQVQGNEKLRRQVARWSFPWGGRLGAEDIVTTAGCMNAVAYCLMALTKAGDTLAVESPVYFGILQLARSLNLNVIELPTDAQTGVDIEALKKAVLHHKVRVCLLVSNFNNPLGSCMPDEHKKAVVRLLEHYGVPLIEDDLYGDVYFKQHRPKSCKSFDESGNVLWCGSVSKTLAPGYRVGWVAAGAFTPRVMKLKLFHTVSSTTLTQEVIANFLETGRYEQHLQQLRRTLQQNSLQFIQAIGNYFPEGTKVSRPEGGFVLWLELDAKVNTNELYEQAMRQKISIAPGRMFTLQNQYNHCLRLSYGLPWNSEVEKALKTLGKLVTIQLRNNP